MVSKILVLLVVGPILENWKNEAVLWSFRKKKGHQSYTARNFYQVYKVLGLPLLTSVSGLVVSLSVQKIVFLDFRVL